MTKSKIEKNNKIAEERKKNDAVINRMMVAFVAAVCGVFGLLYLKRGAFSFNGLSKVEVTFVVHVLPAFIITTGIIFAAALVYFVIQRFRHADDGDRLFNSYNLLGMASVLFAIMLFFKQIGSSYAIIAIVAVTLVYFVFCLYNRDFFWCTLIAAAGTFLLIAARSVSPLISTAAVITMLAIGALVLVFFGLVKLNKGAFMFGDRKISIMHTDYKYYPVIAIAALLIAFALLAVFFADYILYYVIALLAVYLLFGIIYTVKMI